ncbi:Uncharacterised protein [Lysinibacillus capsici]|uniref:Uncharacterized protein n=1 Tax=Lysinibacillus capsici TaxID=2115968 RepID=A0A2X1A1T8_9BACI|nr:hypothetical protein [Lysinibacillus capsici]SPU38249.1 Uncharacterised protein [Lysinibacillus capsici]
MDKNLGQKLKDFDQIFKVSGWNGQIKILSSLGLSDYESSDVDDSEIDQFLDELLFQLSDFYLKNNMETLDTVIENNVDESILINALKKYLNNKWGLREHSLKVSNFDIDQIHFIIEELIYTMMIRRIHRSPNIFKKSVNNKFNTEYEKDDIWNIVTFLSI